MGDHSRLTRAPGEAGAQAASSLGLLNAEHMDVFRNALDRIFLIDIAETIFSEIIDGLPTWDSWLALTSGKRGIPWMY